MSSYAIMTNLGRNKEAAALANGTALSITEIAWGDGDRSPGGGETTLLNEVGRKQIQGNGLVQDALNTAFFEILLDANEGPFVIRESGLFDSDGDLVAIARYDPPINKPKDTVTALVRIHVVFSDLENLVLQVQSSDAYVPVERVITVGNGLNGGGDLSTNRTISADFASPAEALAGTSTTKVMSPARVKTSVQSELNLIKDGAPGALDTLNELAAALGNDPNFATTILSKIGMAAPAGAVMSFASVSAPAGWLECDGSTISRATYSDLFGVVGTTYGAGDGSTTFKLPDLRGEFIRGWDHGRGEDVGRTLGSWQNGTHITGDDGVSTGTVNAVGNLSQIDADPGDNTDRNLIWINATNSGTFGDTIFKRVRPRNVALMFCIKH